MTGASGVLDALARVTAALPAAEERPGQQRMADAVSAAITDGRHLIVQAGTGTGKTLAYLVPAILAGKRTVVATATKALQDQLAAKDLPFLERHLGRPFAWAVLKGRSNYVCLQRLRELGGEHQSQLELDDLAAVRAEVDRLVAWAATTGEGDVAELAHPPSERAWRAVSVSSDECPGRTRCSMGQSCFAEAARQRAEHADVVVVNLHLYGLDVATRGAILPEHDVVVIDEAHQTEDIMSDTVGVEIGPGRLTSFATATRRIIDDPALNARLVDAAGILPAAIADRHGTRLPWPLDDDLQGVLADIRLRVGDAISALGKVPANQGDDVQQRTLRAQQQGGRLAESLDLALRHPDGFVPFVSGPSATPRLEIAPLDVGPQLEAGIWLQRTAILTSATIPASIGPRLGLDEFTQLDVGSPFDFATNGLLYCALDLPDRRSPAFADAAHREIAALVTAAGGRTLALFTSWKAMDAAATAVREMVGVPIITQRERSKAALVRAFSENESTCLFATSGFFQGVDVPGRTLSLVVIDRLPFPRPDDPLLSARRELLGQRAFAEIDVPRASILLAQAAGRLIRTATDRGVVAVLDRRLGTASYRWDIVRALPPMRRTRHRSDAEAFLHQITR